MAASSASGVAILLGVGAPKRCSNKARGLRRKQAEAVAAALTGSSANPAAEPAPARNRASQTWAMRIKLVYESTRGSARH